MSHSKIVSIVMFGFGIAACTTDDEEQAQQDDVAAVTEQAVSAPESCEPLVAIARPILAPHYHDANLTQTAGKLTLRIGGSGVRTGTSLATIVGQTADGVPLGNHDWLFADAGLRTQNDRLALIPTADPCVVDVTSEIYIVASSGAYAGLTGTVTGVGYVNFCGQEGRIAISGHVCP